MNFDFNKGLASLQGTVADLGQSFTPFAKRTRQIISEKLGNNEEITALPDEYVELERRVDALKAVHSQLLGVLGAYENEGYDYPPNIKETLTETARSVQERVAAMSQAQSASEAGSILMRGGSTATGGPAAREPHTLNHALGRAMKTGAVGLTGANLPSLQTALEELGEAEVTIGDARLVQDREVVSVNQGLHNTLENALSFASKARKNVHNARLNLDAAKSFAARNNPAAGQDTPGQPSSEASHDAEVEKAEDEFVAAIEEAVTVMRNVLDTPEPVRGLVRFANAQQAFYKQAAERLAELTPQLEKLQEQQETSYREART